MIVDTHVHMCGHGWVKGKYMRGGRNLEAMEELDEAYNKLHGTNLTRKQVIALRQWYVDPEGDKLVETMDKAGVDVSIIFTVDWALYTDEPPVTIYEQNKLHAKAAKKHEGRLVALCGVDPRRPTMMDWAKQCIEEWGMRGFKLMPSAGFYPTDPICFPLYEKCVDWGVPIVFHTGPEVYWEYGHPMYQASVAHRYPDMKIVMAHCGGIWQMEVEAASHSPNVFMDISSKQRIYKESPKKFYDWLRSLIDHSDARKILFATDWPLPDMALPMVEYVKAVKDAKKEGRFTSKEIDLILGTNAQGVFDL